MKKLLANVILMAVGFISASAQYLPTKDYQNLHYATTGVREADITVVNVDRADNGDINVIFECFAKGPELEMIGGQFSYPMYGSYDAETDISRFTIVTGEYMKRFILSLVKQQMLGSLESEDDIAKLPEVMARLEEAVVVNGQLDVTIDPKAKQGDKMPDSNMSLELGQISYVMNIWNGKYLGMETVTVPAGTFDCIKVEYILRTKNNGVIEKKHAIDWYAKGVGPVKSISVSDSTGEENVEELQSID